MTGSTEKLQQELQAAQQALSEARARYERHNAEHQAATKELEENRGALLFMLEDLEAGRKKIEQAHQEWMAALDVVNAPIFLHDMQFRILRCNKAYQQCAGIPFHELIGQPYYEIFPKNHAPMPCCLRAMNKAEEEEEEEEEVTVGEAIYRSRAFSIHGEQGVYLYSVHTLEDITESRRAEAALHESEEKFRKISESAQDAIIMMADKRISFWNAAAERIFGYTTAEATGQELHALIVPELAHAKFTQAFPHFQQSGEGPIIGKVIEVSALRKGGEEFPVELSISAAQLNGQWHATGIVRDIAERKRAEQALAIQAQISSAFAMISDDELFNEVLKAFLAALHSPFGVFGYVDEAGALVVPTMTRQIWDKCQIPEKTIKFPRETWGNSSWPRALREKRVIYSNEPSSGIPDGHVAIQRHISMPILFRGEAIGLFQVANKEADYTEVDLRTLSKITELVAPLLGAWLLRKRADAATQHANRALAALSAVNRTLVHAASEDDLLQSICQAIVRQRGYRMACVGYMQRDESKSIKIVAHAGHDEGYLDAMQLTWAETERGMGPSGRAIRSGTTQFCQDMANDPLCLPWRDAAQQHGYAASIALPLLNGDNSVFGILNVYAEEVNAFTPGEIYLLEEMAGDLAFGVRGLHIRRQRDLAQDKIRQQMVQLQDSLEDTVRAIATIVEMRDPYTAGHQLRVADLAVALAKQLGLPEEQMHGIRLAGVVHDLGKIQIPAEILSKPGKITDIEFSLIKIHPQAGYNILKGINFPWPVAQMVLQHHERLDGSGYPQGLKGDAILLEARILSVADVVEAISAHRPYRAGLGTETAMEEIIRNRGISYDPRVVDACVALFREQGYVLPG